MTVLVPGLFFQSLSVLSTTRSTNNTPYRFIIRPSHSRPCPSRRAVPSSSRVRLASNTNTCTYRRFPAMDSWSSPNPSDNRRLYGSETDSFSSPAIQRHPSLRQQQSDPQFPLVPITASPPPHHAHTTPPPPVFSNEPALWQLGRHSQYKSDIGHEQQTPTPNGKYIFGSPEGDTFGKWDFGRLEHERVQHQVDRFDESKLIDVEGDLQRGLKARQVRSGWVLRRVLGF